MCFCEVFKPQKASAQLTSVKGVLKDFPRVSGLWFWNGADGTNTVAIRDKREEMTVVVKFPGDSGRDLKTEFYNNLTNNVKDN